MMDCEFLTTNDIVYLLSISSEGTAFTDVSWVTIRTLQTHQTHIMKRPQHTHAIWIYLQCWYEFNVILCRLGLLCSREHQSVQFFPVSKQVQWLNHKWTALKTDCNFIICCLKLFYKQLQLVFCSLKWKQKVVPYLLSICPIASWNTTHTLMTKRKGNWENDQPHPRMTEGSGLIITKKERTTFFPWVPISPCRQTED